MASYHTHAAFSADHHNELPSEQDVESDAEAGMDGYIATPGGRIWHVDGETMVVMQICSVNCLAADPEFIPHDAGPVAKSYTFPELKKRLER